MVLKHPYNTPLKETTPKYRIISGQVRGRRPNTNRSTGFLLSSGLLPSAPEFHRILRGCARGLPMAGLPPIGNWTRFRTLTLPRRKISILSSILLAAIHVNRRIVLFFTAETQSSAEFAEKNQREKCLRSKKQIWAKIGISLVPLHNNFDGRVHDYCLSAAPYASIKIKMMGYLVSDQLNLVCRLSLRKIPTIVSIRLSYGLFLLAA